MRKILPLMVLAACTSTRPVPRTDWGAINNTGNDVTVEMRDGSRHNLDSYNFTNAGVVALRGSSRSSKGARTSLSSGTLIGYDSINVVKVRRMDKGKTFAAAAGVVAASYLIIAMSQDNKRPEAQPRPVTTSCPFIYSFDGTDWRMDSETYAGAIARGLERSDIDNLENIKPVDGVYRLALANQADEIEYTDELSLLVAQHPLGSRVYPDSRGALHTVSESSIPVTLHRRDAVSLPAKARWDATINNPFKGKVSLVLRVRNTQALPFVHLELLNLLGDSVYSWYHTVNSKPAAAARVSKWYEEMAGLQVYTRSGRKQWTRDDVVTIVGPVIAKTIVVPIDVANSETITVRLESSPMLWNIESAELAEEMSPAVVNEIHASRAVDNDGSDVSSALSDRDGRYHIAMTGDRVVAEFEAPRPAAGMKNSVIAKTTGHYYTTSTDERPGNPKLVSRLMTKSVLSQGYFMLRYRRGGGKALIN